MTLGPPPTPNRTEYPFVGSLVWHGLAVNIENKPGSYRSGVDADGRPWRTLMRNAYGEFALTEGMDGDPVDVFIGPDLDAPNVYVIHTKKSGTEIVDEDKAVVGARTAEEARRIFLTNYDKPGFFHGLTKWKAEDFVNHLRTRGHKGKRLDTPPHLEHLAKAEEGTDEHLSADGTLQAWRIQTEPEDVGGYSIGKGPKGASSSAPNYRPGAGFGPRCRTCRFNREGECVTYGFRFQTGFVCDSWVPMATIAGDYETIEPPEDRAVAAQQAELIHQSEEGVEFDAQQEAEFEETLTRFAPRSTKATTTATVRAAVPQDLEGVRSTALVTTTATTAEDAEGTDPVPTGPKGRPVVLMQRLIKAIPGMGTMGGGLHPPPRPAAPGPGGSRPTVAARPVVSPPVAGHGPAQPEAVQGPPHPAVGHKVRFHHQATGETLEGTVTGVGASGATIHTPAGEKHKIPHGQYAVTDRADDKGTASEKKTTAMPPGQSAVKPPKPTRAEKLLFRRAYKLALAELKDEAKATVAAKAFVDSVKQADPEAMAKGQHADLELVFRRALEQAMGQGAADEVDRFRSEWEKEAEAAGQELLGAGQEAQFDALMDSRDDLAGKLTAEDLRKNLGQVELTTSDGTQFRTGTPVTFKYARALEGDQSRFGSDLQPAGAYVFHHLDAGGMKGPGWDTGDLSFRNPLVIEWVAATSEPQGWRARLSYHFGNKAGKDLSRAIRLAGYDGVVTVRTPWKEASEIVDLRRTIDWANTSPARVLMRFATQMGLFGRPKPPEEPKHAEPEKPPSGPPAKHEDRVVVRAHIAKTEHGLVQVKEHERKVEKHAEAPKPAAPARHVDVGEVIRGARKHTWQPSEGVHSHNLDDIEAGGEELAVRHVVKKAIFGDFDAVKNREMGSSPGATWLKKKLLDAVAVGPSPAAGSAWRRAYVEGAEWLQKELDRLHTTAEVTEFVEQWREIMHGRYLQEETFTADQLIERFGEGTRTTDWGVTRGSKLVNVAESNRTGKVVYDTSSDYLVRTVSKEALEAKGYDGQPHTTYRPDGTRVFRLYKKVPTSENALAKYAMALGGVENPTYEDIKSSRLLNIIHQGLGRGTPAWWDKDRPLARRMDQTDDWSQLIKDPTKADEPKRKGERWTRATTTPRREGGPPVDLKDVSGDRLMRDFGFRGVQHGNWVNDESRDYHMARTIEALTDLADIVGIDKHAIAHSGELGIAFGARGKGKAGAHYEPTERVINLTHTRGAGSLAHEWAHFFDHVLTDNPRSIEMKPGGKTHSPMVSAGSAATNLHAEVQAGFKAVMQAMHFGPAYTAEEVEAVWKTHRQRSAELRAERHEVSKLSGPEKVKAIDAYNEKAKDHNAEERRLRANVRVGKLRQTSYHEQAERLGKTYWATPHEMFARAFESFVEDRLKGEKRANTYLVEGTDHLYQGLQPYPQGEERDRINLAMGHLVQAMSRHQSLRKAFARHRARIVVRASALEARA